MKKIIKLKTNKKKLNLCNLHIKCNFKNTLISLTEKNGNVLKQWSTKSLKKTKFKKNTFYNILLIINKINKYIKLKNIKKLNIFLYGIGIAKNILLKNLNKIKIYYIFNKINLSFNGCKKKKIKRY